MPSKEQGSVETCEIDPPVSVYLRVSDSDEGKKLSGSEESEKDEEKKLTGADLNGDSLAKRSNRKKRRKQLKGYFRRNKKTFQWIFFGLLMLGTHLACFRVGFYINKEKGTASPCQSSNSSEVGGVVETMGPMTEPVTKSPNQSFVNEPHFTEYDTTAQTEESLLNTTTTITTTTTTTPTTTIDGKRRGAPCNPDKTDIEKKKCASERVVFKYPVFKEDLKKYTGKSIPDDYEVDTIMVRCCFISEDFSGLNGNQCSPSNWTSASKTIHIRNGKEVVGHYAVTSIDVSQCEYKEHPINGNDASNICMPNIFDAEYHEH